MPRVDPVMLEGTIKQWLKREGDSVIKGETVAMAEGEKTTFEIQAPASAILRKILAPEGTTVRVGVAIGLVGAATEPIISEEGEGLPLPGPKAPEPQIIASAERVRASPAARKLAEEKGLDLTKLVGTGPDGRITREDVERAIWKISRPEELVAPGARQPSIRRVVELAGLRKSIAERLSYSARQAVQVTISTEVIMDNILGVRRQWDKEVSLTAFVVKAVAEALKEFPELNSSLVNSEIRIYNDINIAVAIHTQDGLVAPVIPDVDKKSVDEISASIENLSRRASERKLAVSDLTGSTFTVSNLGPHGVDSFSPIINPPNTAILGVGRIVKKPVVTDNEIEIKSIANLSLVFDHRVIDGAPAAAFLSRIREILEAWR